MEEYKYMEQETQIDVIFMLSRESRIGVNGIDSNEAENVNASSHHTLLRLDKDDFHIVVQSLEQQLCIKLHNCLLFLAACNVPTSASKRFANLWTRFQFTSPV